MSEPINEAFEWIPEASPESVITLINLGPHVSSEDAATTLESFNAGNPLWVGYTYKDHQVTLELGMTQSTENKSVKWNKKNYQEGLIDPFNSGKIKLPTDLNATKLEESVWLMELGNYNAKIQAWNEIFLEFDCPLSEVDTSDFYSTLVDYDYLAWCDIQLLNERLAIKPLINHLFPEEGDLSNLLDPESIQKMLNKRKRALARKY